MTSLRQRMLDELQRRNYTPDTIRGYIHAIKDFAEYFGRSPEAMGAEEVREFQLYMIREKKLALGTVALRMGALRFLYKKTLRRRDIDIEDLPLVRAPKKLPVVLSQEEVVRLIEGGLNLRHRTILMLLYATGLRRAEAVHLKISDIDPALMLIHVHQGKGSRDRDLPLTAKLLEALREYWRWCKNKPRTYLFPSRVELIQPERPLSDKVVWNACHEAALRAGLTKRIGPRAMTLPHEEFLRRFFQHVLPTGFPRIRYFGFLANRSRKLLLPLCRQLLDASPPSAAMSASVTLVHSCPRCQAPMRIIERLTAFQLEYENHRLVVDLDSS